ncbi:hypothetical protein C8R44DRAFT_789762 [Mycena epipterygia]|nr:hypothetical protein C8R44DRAFT_789762 [Mycena epipterygia]
MSVTSSKTLSAIVPHDLVDLILSHTIGQVIHEAVEATIHGQSFASSCIPCWSSVSNLAGVSTNFRAIVLKMLALAFRVPLPCESSRILSEAHQKFRSLLLFGAATVAGAVMDPPAGSPLMQAYGHYFKAKCLALRPPLHHSVVVLRTRKTETSLALSFCSATVEALSQPLVNVLLADSKLGAFVDSLPIQTAGVKGAPARFDTDGRRTHPGIAVSEPSARVNSPSALQ